MIHALRPTTFALIAALLATLSASHAVAAEPASLKGDVLAARDTLTLGDLVGNAPAALAGTPLFRAPALGQTGTIQAARIVAAAEALGLPSVETGGRMQVSVTRAARHVGAAEIEAALKKRLAADFGADPAATGISFDGPQPAMLLAPEVAGDAVASDTVLDRRSRRVSATVWIGPSPTERRAQVRVTGVLVELVDVAVINRPLERGQAVKASDVTVERRARDLVPGDAIYDGLPVEGRVARRALSAGTFVRSADLMRPELVARGDIVSVVYEVAGLSLALKGKANEGGALGDAITVTNPQSKKVLQATIAGPGRVTVGPAAPGRLASASNTAQP